MTAGWGDNDGNTQNPKMGTGTSLDPYGGNPKWPIDRIGMLQNNQQFPLNGSKIYTLNFLYNPNQINVSFSTDPTVIPTQITSANAASDPQFSGASAPSLTTSQSVSWSLIFDRTYDLTYGPNPAGNRGVLKDVGALYLLMGAFTAEGVPFSTLVDVIFGQTSDGDVWGFTGYITSANITYGIFRQNMIPSRCEVDLTLTAVYVGPATPSNGSSGGSGTTVPGSSPIPIINNPFGVNSSSTSSGTVNVNPFTGQTLVP
jgi:hypothetical protein